MKSGRVIEVSKSSLISLKAEIVKKHEEVEKCKGSGNYIRPLTKKKKETISNPGVDGRSARDRISKDDVDLLQKSKEVLHYKSDQYDKLSRGEVVTEDDGDSYLVDFKEKMDKVFLEASSASPGNVAGEAESDQGLEDDCDDWVDYVDCLGRTRRCLKEDYLVVKQRDELVSKMLGKEPEINDPVSESGAETEPDEYRLEMVTNDMIREKMREKWEHQEKELSSKKNIYYEDVRFDEARSHGVAYYGFSTVDAAREEQQAEFKRMRDETAVKQKETQDAKERRDSMKQARLVAARQRQRARLGLPPLPVLSEDSSVRNVTATEETTIKTDESSEEDQRAALVRAAHVRPWDVGKSEIKSVSNVMNQQEWVQTKRLERREEFAPPSLYRLNDTTVKEDDDGIPLKRRRLDLSDNSRIDSVECVQHPREGASVPCPPLKTASYYQLHKANSYSKSMHQSIEAGLQYLRQQSENRDRLIKKKFQH